MRRKLYIPFEVKESIQKHLNDAISRSVDGYLSANEDEDTMTGHLGALLKIGSQPVAVRQSEIGGTWSWSIDYYKFRGRGKNATEGYVGADGILELSLYGRGRIETKSILFQAKTDWGSNKDLLEQCIKLSTWREAAFVVNYTPNEYEAFSIDQVLRGKGNRRTAGVPIPLEQFLGKQFLDCEVGDNDLQYDAALRRLMWVAANGEFVSTQFSIKQRLRINVRPPNPSRIASRRVDREVPIEEIHKYRMDALAVEMLGLSPNPTVKEISAARKKIALAYHPDTQSLLNAQLKELLNRRMSEFNHRLDEIESHRRRHH